MSSWVDNNWILYSVRRLVSRGTFAQFVRFCMVGTVSTTIDFGLYLILTRSSDFWSQHLVSASAISFTAAVFVSFILNAQWTFRFCGNGWHRRAVPFFAVAVGGLAINSVVVWSVVLFGVWDVIAKVVATAVVLSWNFSMHRKWTFKLI